MAKVKQLVPSQWGNVEIELLACDECMTMIQVPHAIGWLQLFRLDTAGKTMGGALPEESHYCSTTCLRAVL